MRIENAHLLTFTDPRPAADARKRKAAQEQAKCREQADADAAALAAMAPEVNEKACILSAAERLPRTPGIEIKASRTKALPPDSKQEPSLFYRVVQHL